MPQSATYRTFKRRIGQITRRMNSGPQPKARQISSQVMDILSDLRRSSETEPEVAVELALSLLEILPRIFTSLDDRQGLLGAALDHVPQLLTDLLLDSAADPTSVIDRYGVFERIFSYWVDDDSGYLQALDECLLAAAANRDDEETLLEIGRVHLRDMPLIFPPATGERLDVDRSIQLAERYRIEKLLGEIYARRGNPGYLVIAARAYFRLTGDAVDYVTYLHRAGEDDEALEVARRVLRNPAATRHGAVKQVYEEIVLRRERADRNVDELIAAFLMRPSLDAFADLKDALGSRWNDVRERVLGDLESAGSAPELAFRLYLEEGMITEADGMVVTAHLDPFLLAESAEEIIDQHPDRAAGWLLTAAYRIVSDGGRAPDYHQAAIWLGTVRVASELTGQADGFSRAMSEFRQRYSRRRALLRILAENGL